MGIEVKGPRIEAAKGGFVEEFGYTPDKFHIFSAPGRTEIGGNHTDHQHGNVLAAAVSIDTIGVAVPNNTGIVRVHTEGYETDEVDIGVTDILPEERDRSRALIRGVASHLSSKGFKLGGFDAYTVNDIPRGSGLSSSAAYEVLIGTIFNHLFNSGGIGPLEIALAGKYAENEHYGKPCGLMDQLTSAWGGLISIDFNKPADAVVTDNIYDFSLSGHKICIIETGGDHKDLTDEYAAIPREMGAVAGYFGKEVLRDVPEEEFYRHLSVLRGHVGGRAVLRAIHFFNDNRRVGEEVLALKNNKFDRFLSLVNESGRSSWTHLQNISPGNAINDQPVALALALAEKLLGGYGAVRVHGGGFAGTIQAFVPDYKVDGFKSGMERLTGAGTCRILEIREAGGVRLDV